ncbi:MAG: trehalose-6-phosphate synthase, partial [Bdellovibrionota bacterium]
MTKPKRIFVSNRLPFNISTKTGDLQRGSGGLVSALMGVHLDQPFYWLGFETDPGVAAELKQKAQQVDKQLRLQPVVINKKLYDSYYDKFSNDVLWPLFHYESQHVLFRREDWNSYVEANRLMADEILKVAIETDTVWIHDFHFFLLPAMLKERMPKLQVGFFLHIPFPSSEIFRQLPVRQEILAGLIKADLIGFHEHSYLRHFTVSLTAQMGIDSSFLRAQIGDHTLNLGVYPISIDNEGLKEKSESAAVTARTHDYENEIKSNFLVLGVDRLDYSKGLELKLRGFRRMLKKYPDVRGEINLLQVAVPTRTKVPAYMRLKKEVDQLVGTINGEFGQPGYVPVQYIFNSVVENDLLALYRRADSILITSKRDGM